VAAEVVDQRPALRGGIGRRGEHPYPVLVTLGQQTGKVFDRFQGSELAGNQHQFGTCRSFARTLSNLQLCAQEREQLRHPSRSAASTTARC
jgi:hypothetical protein